MFIRETMAAEANSNKVNKYKKNHFEIDLCEKTVHLLENWDFKHYVECWLNWLRARFVGGLFR